MSFQTFLKIAIINLTHRRVRSWLTIIGVVIGIAAIVSLISISNGMEHAISEQFEKFGTRMVGVAPKGFHGPASGVGVEAFDDSDVKALERISEIEFVVPILVDMPKVEYKREEYYTYVWGMRPEKEIGRIFEKMGFGIASGRYFQPGEKYVAILGAKVGSDVLDEKIRSGSRIYINDKKFKVIGILKEVGNSQDDTAIMIPVDAAKEVLKKEGYAFIFNIVKEGVDPEKVGEDIRDALEKSRNKEDFMVLTPKQLLERISSMLEIIQLVLVGIAGISLLVGAVGIMNTTYTAVLERTREIGIMKAVGATNKQILLIFLIESGIIGLVGGAIGAALGTVIAQGVGAYASNLSLPIPLKIIVEWKLIGFSIAFSFALGMLAGLLPAWRAAKLKPADSLRYE